MKKILSLVIVLVLSFAMVTASFADVNYNSELSKENVLEVFEEYGLKYEGILDLEDSKKVRNSMKIQNTNNITL